MITFAVLILLLLWVPGIYTVGYTVTGLTYDLFGVLLLLEQGRRSQWTQFRYQATMADGGRVWEDIMHKRPKWEIGFLWVAKSLGSSNLMDINEPRLEEALPINILALFLLLLGFLLQIFGNMTT